MNSGFRWPILYDGDHLSAILADSRSHPVQKLNKMILAVSERMNLKTSSLHDRIFANGWEAFVPEWNKMNKDPKMLLHFFRADWCEVNVGVAQRCHRELHPVSAVTQNQPVRVE